MGILNGSQYENEAQDSKQKDRGILGNAKLENMKPDMLRVTAPISRRNPLIGKRIQGRYEIRDIKHGGMSIVYLCYDHSFQEPIALKTFSDIYLHDRAFVKRFWYEAENWSRLERHHNIVQ